ncbi:FtsH protease activity modulator HflK [Defluviicoccus vanus]|uniref:Protein HflK n=1 Tax=Defluviicoccus vanus TaxID=111831 RepID=A0A7H1N4S3_9PROT|nr:FtsH protease activity modulator HflK [Defluviicoccus vanus]QNT70709.1 FtsH protease activity modulator HflK [Defluviicoccus vanus]
MAWNPKGGGGGPWGGGGGGGPWGSGPSSSQPPDIEEMVKRTQERVKRMLPLWFGSGRGIILAIVAVVGIWLATGVYQVRPGEQSLELLFGKFVGSNGPGLNYWFPTPIGEVQIVNVEQTNQINVGFRGAGEGGRGSSPRDVLHESLMLTLDQNIVDVDMIVQWRIKNAPDFAFNIRSPQETIKLVSESAIREVMGQTLLEDALTLKRQDVDDRTKQLIQQILDAYGAGVLITEVKQLKVDPPAEVIDAFNDVQRARQDQDRLVNEALAYRNDIVPRAKGDAERIVQAAAAYKDQLVRESEGDAKRFLSVYEAYLSGKDVTMRRLFLERMQDVLKHTQNVIVDQAVGGSGVVPYLPLPEIQRQRDQRSESPR